MTERYYDEEYARGLDAVVTIEKRNWDQECEISLITKRGFIIDQAPYKKSGPGKEKVKNIRGIHSQLYGTDWEDEDAFAERYRCACSHLKGKRYEGMECTYCNQVVSYRDADIEVMGWMILKHHKIIQPLYYRMLNEAVSTKAIPFRDIIESAYTIDTDGNIVKKERAVTNDFVGIGTMGLYKRFDEFIDYYIVARPTQAKYLEGLRKDKDKIFASCIPVYSSLLRPSSSTEESYFTYTSNKIYRPMQSKVKLLNRIEEDSAYHAFKSEHQILTTHNALSSLQQKIMELWQDTYSLIDGKHGHLRGEIAGGRLNFTARNVIIPDKSLRADEVRMGYTTFLELYRYQIISILKSISRITYVQAAQEWEHGTRVFSPKIYSIINHLITKNNIGVVVNRNPTINFESVTYLRIIEVRKAIDKDYTLSLPLMILNGMNADFDGDEVNVHAVMLEDLHKGFDNIYNPRKSFMISRDNGLVNTNTDLIKDQAIGLYNFNNI